MASFEAVMRTFLFAQRGNKFSGTFETDFLVGGPINGEARAAHVKAHFAVRGFFDGLKGGMDTQTRKARVEATVEVVHLDQSTVGIENQVHRENNQLTNNWRRRLIVFVYGCKDDQTR